MISRVDMAILFISLTIVANADIGDCLESYPLNLTLTAGQADFPLYDDSDQINNSSIIFRNVTLCLNNSSVDLTKGYIKSENATISSELAAIHSGGYETYISNTTVEMKNSSLSLLNSELSSDQSELKALNSSLHLNASKTSIINGTFSLTKQESSEDTDTWMEQANTTLADFNKNWIHPLLSIFDILASMLIFILVLYLIYRSREYLGSLFGLGFMGIGRSELVFDKIINSSGDETLDKRLDGISQYAREELANSIEYIQEKVEAHTRDQETDLGFREFMPLPSGTPRETPKKSLSDILATTKDVTPEIWKPLLPLICILFPPKGIRISCILQLEGDKDSKLGVTIKVADMEEKLEPRIHTIWERDGSSQQSKYTLPDETKAQYLFEVGEYLKELHLCSDAMKYYKEGLKLVGSDSISGLKSSEIENNISKCSKNLAELERTTAFYSAGEKFHDKDPDKALKNYVLSLPEYRDEGERIWRSILKTNNVDKSAKYLELAKFYNKSGMVEEALKLFILAREKGSNDANKEIRYFKDNRIEMLLKCASLLEKLNRGKEAKTFLVQALNLDPNNSKVKVEIEKVDQELIKGKSLSERYAKLLKSASIWTATEIRRMDLLQNVPWNWQFNRKEYISHILNFFGVLNLYHAQLHGSDYYKFSKDDLESANQQWSDWYLPCENLGLWYHLKGQEDKDSSLHIEAIRWYEDAKSKADQWKVDVMNRITIAEAISCYLSEDNALKAEAKEKITELDDTTRPLDSLCGWKSARSLYNLACWYEIAQAEYTPKDNAEKRARICLAYSLARDKDRNLWKAVDIDRDLKRIKEIESLKFKILIKANDLKYGRDNKGKILADLNTEEFQKEMGSVLKDMNWVD